MVTYGKITKKVNTTFPYRVLKITGEVLNCHKQLNGTSMSDPWHWTWGAWPLAYLGWRRAEGWNYKTQVDCFGVV